MKKKKKKHDQARGPSRRKSRRAASVGPPPWGHNMGLDPLGHLKPRVGKGQAGRGQPWRQQLIGRVIQRTRPTGNPYVQASRIRGAAVIARGVSISVSAQGGKRERLGTCTVVERMAEPVPRTVIAPCPQALLPLRPRALYPRQTTPHVHSSRTASRAGKTLKLVKKISSIRAPRVQSGRRRSQDGRLFNSTRQRQQCLINAARPGLHHIPLPRLVLAGGKEARAPPLLGCFPPGVVARDSARHAGGPPCRRPRLQGPAGPCPSPARNAAGACMFRQNSG